MALTPADAAVVFLATLAADLLVLAVVAAVLKLVVLPRARRVALDAVMPGPAFGARSTDSTMNESDQELADLLAEADDPTVEVGTGDVQDQLHDEEALNQDPAPPGVTYEQRDGE